MLDLVNSLLAQPNEDLRGITLMVENILHSNFQYTATFPTQVPVRIEKYGRTWKVIGNVDLPLPRDLPFVTTEVATKGVWNSQYH